MTFLKLPKTIGHILLKCYVHKKQVKNEFCNDYNLPNLAEQKTCYEISQNQICIDHLQITAG